MGEMKNNNGDDKKKSNNNNKEGGEKKKEDGPITVVLKIDMHCEGCASKIVKTVRGFTGVNADKSDFAANKLSVIGKVDPAKLREGLAEKLKKKVDLISPLPKKSDGNDGDANKKKSDSIDNKKNPKEKEKEKEKEPPVTTAVFKLRLHCQGCIEKIHKTVTKTKGYNDMKIDKQKDLVTVIGSMDMKALAESLTEKLKRPVEIVPPKKDNKDGDKSEKGVAMEKKKEKPAENGGKMEENRMEYMAQPVYGFGLGYGPGFGPGYGPGFGPGHGNGFGYPPPPMPGYTGEQLHAPQMFSDENPNACSVM